MRTPRTRTHRTLTAAALTAAVLTLTACGSGDPGGGDGSGEVATVDGAQREGGITLDTPFAKPDLTLTDDEGGEFDLVEETAGEPTLLYFGYTHCPDVCPLTMSNIAVAASKLPAEQRERLRVVFVTSDPERDTPERLDAWLRMHDPSFIGLTGDFDTIQAGARGVGIHIGKPYKRKNGDIVSTHGTQLLVFSPEDDKAHVLYPEDRATADQLSEDLPKLVEGRPL